jgi:hypothetical protein
MQRQRIATTVTQRLTLNAADSPAVAEKTKKLIVHHSPRA